MNSTFYYWYITRDEVTEKILNCAVHYYKGNKVTIEFEDPATHEISYIDKFEIVDVLSDEDMTDFLGENVIDITGEKCRKYTSEDFGDITLETDLKAFLTDELEKCPYSPIFV